AKSTFAQRILDPRAAREPAFKSLLVLRVGKCRGDRSGCKGPAFRLMLVGIRLEKRKEAFRRESKVRRRRLRDALPPKRRGNRTPKLPRHEPVAPSLRH